jgi:DNA helicase HerA-like ATPase
LEITALEWKGLFDKIFEVENRVEMEVVRNGSKLEFFLRTEKKLEALNGRLAPFYLSEDFTEKEIVQVGILRKVSGIKPILVNKSMLAMMEKGSVNREEVQFVSFISNKYSLLKTLPRYQMVISKGGRSEGRVGWFLIHVFQFLEFNLSNSINSEISRVKPILATSNLNFPLEDNGVMEIKSLNSAKRFGVGSYDFWRHSLIVGQSGSGKSYLIKLLVDDLYQKFKNEYGVVMVDPHASLDGLMTVPREVVDFKIKSTNIFVNVGEPILATELTMDLFSTVMNVRENQNLARVLKFALTCLFEINKMSLENLKNLLTDSIYRKEILKESRSLPVQKFFETEYQQIFTSQYAVAVLPVINLLAELEFLGQVKEKRELADLMNSNFMVSVPIKQTELGSNVTKIIGGAMIQQVFTLMLSGKIKKKIILVIDEISVVQTPSLVHILSEARKFGLTVVMAQQYLMQVSGEILQSVFANMVNYFCFKLARDDAEVAAKNLNCEIDQYFLKNKNDPKEMQEMSVKLLTDLNPREVIARVMSDNRYYDPFKGKTVDVII